MDSQGLAYRILFKDHAGEVFGTDILFAADDESAILTSRKILRMGIGDTYELWRGETMIYAGKLLSE
jgi:hypothetical protein